MSLGFGRERFVERFNPVVVTAADMLEGPFVHWVSVRHSPPAGRPTSHVATDLLIHDVDLALRLHGTNPIDLLPDLDDPRLPMVTGAVGRPGDPLTGEVRTDSEGGLLQPNNARGQGAGFVGHSPGCAP